MLKRIDLNKKDRKLYPQYFKDTSFVETEDGRFYLASEVDKKIQKLLDIIEVFEQYAKRPGKL